jgi:hypothetical protein
MAPLLRLMALGSVLLFACAPATAQLPVAPEPHLALDELVNEYKRLGLPLPPENAELVLIKQRPGMCDELGFRVPRPKFGGAESYLIGTSSVIRADVVERINDRTALEGIDWHWSAANLLCLVAQSRIRGRNEFAERLYARIRKTSSCTRAGVAEMWGPMVYEEWRSRLWRPESNREEILRYLKEAVPYRNADIRDLELTLAPRKSKPGTVEFLIDDLTDYWNGSHGFLKSVGTPAAEWERGEEAYLKLAEIGFDAVPALLEHLKDPRFTRYKTNPDFTDPRQRDFAVRVGHVTSWLLYDLSGGQVGYEAESNSMTDPKDAREWWERAQKFGEEKWLMNLVLPNQPYDGEKFIEAGGTPYRAIARALGAKYPTRLAEAYQQVLHERTPVESGVLTRAIVLSKLPRERKLSLLEEGAKHKEFAHRTAALDALADLDTPTFHKHLIATIKSHPEEDLDGLVRRTDDPACWDALTAVAKRAPVQHRLTIIDRMRWATTPEQDKKTRRERLRFLVGFLTDETAGDGWFNAVPGDPAALQVRDLAAVGLAQWLELKVELDNNRGPFSRAFIRAAVAKVAAEELARLKK